MPKQLFLLFLLLLAHSLPAQSPDASWSVSVLDQLFAAAPPGQQTIQVGDMEILASRLRQWRNHLAGGPGPKLAFDGLAPTWTAGNVYYTFDVGVSAAKQRCFLDGAADWATFANLHFILRTSQSNYVTIIENPSLAGGQSAVGMIGGQQFLQFGPNAWNRGTICHELGHTLGLIHEHQRTNRNAYVSVLTNNIAPGAEPNFILLANSKDKTSYDFLSVMHYNRNSFPKTNGLDTLVPLPAYTNYLNLMGALYDPILSASDRAGMAAVYGAGPALSSVVTNTQDSGPGSLRAAIYYALDNPATTITFNIATNNPGLTNRVFRIQVTDGYPSLGNATVIDGSTQPVNLNSNGPAIQLDGSLAQTTSVFPCGLVMKSNNCSIRNLVINNFANNAIWITGSNAIGNTVRGCYLGVGPAGTNAAPNGVYPVLINGGANRNTIGGTNAAARNIISGSLNQGVLLSDPGTSGNLIQGNYIGLSVTGTNALPNTWGGIAVALGSQSNLIGGTIAGARNVISGNNAQGITFTDTNTIGNMVQGNYVGLNASGTAAVPNAYSGINFFGGAHYNQVGGTAAGSGNVISGNHNQGILIQHFGSIGNLIQGNYIGTGPQGTNAIPNGFHGVQIAEQSQSNIVGGTLVSARNIISGNTLSGVSINDSGTVGNQILGNYIGLDVGGGFAVPNGSSGIGVYGARGNIIGGSAGNVVSGNVYQGIVLSGPGTIGNSIFGNTVGLNAAGSAVVPNTGAGIGIYGGAQSNQIGGPLLAQRNFVSGNAAQGIVLGNTNTTGNVVQGNFVGCNPSGTSVMGNAYSGIELSGGASANLVGGNFAGGGNLVSGNQFGVGIFNPGTIGNLVQGNLIGLNASGTGALPNSIYGVLFGDRASANLIGGPFGARNYVSGNLQFGVVIGDNCANNLFQGNTVGLGITGAAVPNAFAGVAIFSPAVGNQIGGTTPGTANLIASNSSEGVFVSDVAATNNSIRGNSIYGNSGAGIILYSSANRSAAAPILASAVLSNVLAISVNFTSTPSSTFHLDFYSSPAPIFSSQARTWLGTKDVATGPGGITNFSLSLTTAVPIGRIITATATDLAGNTSGLSPGVTVTAIDNVHDGIPDGWRKAYFGGTGATTNSQSCAACDPDQDGLSNQQEFLAGTNPTNAASTLKFSSISRSNADLLLGFQSQPGISYQVNYRAGVNLSNWLIRADEILGNGALLQLTDPNATLAPQGIYRLVVSP